MPYRAGPEESISVAVLRAVSSHENRLPWSLPHLTDAIDPDALNNLIAAGDDSTDRNIFVSFKFSNSIVTVDQDGYISVEARGNPPSIR